MHISRTLGRSFGRSLGRQLIGFRQETLRLWLVRQRISSVSCSRSRFVGPPKMNPVPSKNPLGKFHFIRPFVRFSASSRMRDHGSKFSVSSSWEDSVP